MREKLTYLEVHEEESHEVVKDQERETSLVWSEAIPLRDEVLSVKKSFIYIYKKRLEHFIFGTIMVFTN